MPSTIVKVAPDRDLYMEWSSIVDAPTFFGTRAETLAYLANENGRRHPGFTPNEGNRPEDCLARADETGTSARDERGKPWNGTTWPYPPEGHWDDHGFIWDQRGTLPRARLSEAADWIVANGNTELPAAMLNPFEDMTEEDREQYRNGCDDRGVVWADWEVKAAR